MVITNIKSNPIFIQKYIENNNTELDHMLDCFKRFIINKDSSAVNFKDNIMLIEYFVDDNDFNIRYFVNYYLTKSSLNNKYECDYEVDLGIAKSISNETFSITLNINNHIQDDINIIIESCDNNKLILKII